MSKFKKVDERSAPTMNTASLPDIVFMLLFFFMVATTSKENDPTVKVTSPGGTHTEDLTPYKQRSEIDFLYLGAPRNPNRSADFKFGFALSLDNVVSATPDGLYSTNDVEQWKRDKKDQKPSSMTKGIESIITCVKADENAPSGLIFDIRKQLQKCEAFKIAYAVNDKSVNTDDSE